MRGGSSGWHLTGLRETRREEKLWAAGISEHFLKPAYFSMTTNEWTFPEGYVVDTEEDRVTMQIDHFTDFALIGAPGFQAFLPLVVR